jgi:transcriptional regulator with XRE-family HTH domain
MADEGSTVARRQLGRKLRRLREDSGKTIKSVSDARIMSESKLARIEKGAAGAVKVGDVLVLCRFFEADGPMTDALVQLAEGTARDGWWEDNPDVVPQWFSMYIGLEASASVLCSYHPEVVHGLLQTEDYARAVLGTDGPKDPEVVQAQLKLRMERQHAVLARSGRRRLRVVLGPGTFALTIGSPAIMDEQRAHLLRLTEDDSIDIRAIPSSSGAHAGLTGPFMLLDFDDPDDPPVVYLESLTGARYLEQTRAVAEYRRVFDRLMHESVPLKEMT